MKLSKIFKVAALISALTLAFSSCSSDNDDVNIKEVVGEYAGHMVFQMNEMEMPLDGNLSIAGNEKELTITLGDINTPHGVYSNMKMKGQLNNNELTITRQEMQVMMHGKPMKGNIIEGKGRFIDDLLSLNLIWNTKGKEGEDIVFNLIYTVTKGTAIKKPIDIAGHYTCTAEHFMGTNPLEKNIDMVFDIKQIGKDKFEIRLPELKGMKGMKVTGLKLTQVIAKQKENSTVELNNEKEKISIHMGETDFPTNISAKGSIEDDKLNLVIKYEPIGAPSTFRYVIKGNKETTAK